MAAVTLIVVVVLGAVLLRSCRWCVQFYVAPACIECEVDRDGIQHGDTPVLDHCLVHDAHCFLPEQHVRFRQEAHAFRVGVSLPHAYLVPAQSFVDMRQVMGADP